ncbi:alkane 1-monooxygenase [Aquicoccus porphyridii]|uniref:Alkane 1-monooxygenase n=1 Tax=Aquicoccus porphyridii TaxID=1852029 RepID=A0A5A9Z8J8_9RHOB|nr:alkane 1-monooxygenase [Aquicoccus porphyridii]KAA0913275.1 alkane 1-monooxygenase [Aquicoccus porphyridii]RAI52290.1 alkane 1-monooxygenase [Rhodobacteraceae bacterium AsT-22]
MITAETIARPKLFLPFWMTYLLVPVAWISAVYGGWSVILLPLLAWWVFSGLDGLLGLNRENADTDIGEDALYWYRMGVMLWVPVQFVTLYGILWYVTASGHLGWIELLVLFASLGVISGTVGIVYAHELLHQRNRLERWLGDILLAMVLYSHFRTEHLLVHHPYVGTPRDTVTARYNENFHRYFARVLREGLKSAFRAEKEKLAKKNLPWTDARNPFWRYWALQGLALALALYLGGWLGLVLFLVQALSAVWQLELTNYVEHYGLTRKHLGDGKYEHVKPHHSWNAAHKATNWLLINLQRHSDHHYKPDRRFPLLQNYSEAQAPQLPYGYPIMTLFALWPRKWRQVMNPRVARWREMYYPEITDWKPYNKHQTPMPR